MRSLFYVVVTFLIISRFVKCCRSGPISVNVSDYNFRDYNNDRCEYIINPHPEKSIQFVVHCGFEVEFRLIFNIDGVENEMYYKKVETQSSYCYKSEMFDFPIGVGLRVKMYNVDDYLIKADMRGVDTYDGPCGYPYVVIGSNETMIQKAKGIEKGTRCVYRLVPDMIEGYNEIIITTTGNYAIRLHNNGTIEKMKDYDGSKTFAMEVMDLYVTKRYSFTDVTASLLHKSCNCGQTTFSNFSSDNRMRIRSPGFPSANCPAKECSYEITYETTEPEVLMFSFQNDLVSGDRLIVHERKNGHRVFESTVSTLMNFTFEPRNFDITYSAGDLHSDRSFEIEVTRIPISEECRCSSYWDKYYDHPTSINITIPKTCDSIFCNWHIRRSANIPYRHGRVIVEMMLENSNKNDQISCDSEMFYARNLVSKTIYSTSDFPVNIAFQRLNSENDVNTRLTINWTYTTDCYCGPGRIYLNPNENKIITSPNYPDKYCDSLKCSNWIIAPNNTVIELKIETFQLENFHDYLRIYDENTDMVAELTGKYTNHTIVSTGNIMELLFESDINEGYKGYLIRVTLREIETNQHYWLLVALFIVFLVIILVITVYVLRKIGERKSRSSNGTVHFQNFMNESSTNINVM